METIYTDLENSIISELKIELSKEATFDEALLAIKVRSAIREIKSKRMYENSFLTEEEIEKDMWKYYANIKNLARYDYNQIGIEGQINHSENNISRTYHDRDKCFNGVVAFAKII